MTDNRLAYSTGYWPEPMKYCTRCGRVVECTLYTLCDNCHEDDRLAALFEEDQRLEHDRKMEISEKRYGGAL